MHQSKGLEYNVCFLFGLGKGFNKQAIYKSTVFFNRERGVALKLAAKDDEKESIFTRTRIKPEPNILYRLSYDTALEKLVEEEARLFYVALTRARERLYLSATISNSYDALKSKYIGRSDNLDKEYRSASSYFVWTLLSLLNFEDKNDLFEIIKYQKGAIPPSTDPITPEELESIRKIIAEEEEKAQTVKNAVLIEEGKLTQEEVEIKKGEEEAKTAQKSAIEGSLTELLRSSAHKITGDKRLALIPAKVAASKTYPKMLDEMLLEPTSVDKLFSESGKATDENQLPEAAKQIMNRIRLMQSRKINFDNELNENQKASAAEKGTATHLVLQHCNYKNVEEKGLEAEIERLIRENFISEKTKKLVNVKQLKGFFESIPFKKALTTDKVWREFRFGLFRPAAEYTENDELKKALDEKKIFVQGSIDLIVETKDGLILCDYKTDKISAEELADRTVLIENMKKKHADQLAEYRFAVKEIFGKSPEKIYIYSIPLGDVIELF
jgi:ATP-dependent helicase/nuclease subunit A